MSDDSDRQTAEAQHGPDEGLPEIPQGESEPVDLLLEERSTPELRRWLRSRYQATTGREQ